MRSKNIKIVFMNILRKKNCYFIIKHIFQCTSFIRQYKYEYNIYNLLINKNEHIFRYIIFLD